MNLQESEPIGLLIRDLHLEISSYLTKLLVPIRLAPEQHLLMVLLLEREGLSQSEIAALLKKDKASVARMIASLEKKKYIRKTVSGHDRRSVNIFVTEEGKKLESRIKEIADVFGGVIEKDLSSSEVAALKGLLSQVRRNIKNA